MRRFFQKCRLREFEPLPADTIAGSDAPEVKEFDRDIESVVFIPKGQWITGVNISYTQSNQNDYQFLIFQGISGDTYSFKVSPMLMYAIAPDLALGGRFSYARQLTKLEKADIVLDSETEYNVDHLYRLSHNYYGTVMMRNYFSIGNSKRFGFFSESAASDGWRSVKDYYRCWKGSDLSTYERNLSFGVGLAPGICVFLSNYSALEVNVGVLGFSYVHTKAIRDRSTCRTVRQSLQIFVLICFPYHSVWHFICDDYEKNDYNSFSLSYGCRSRMVG